MYICIYVYIYTYIHICIYVHVYDLWACHFHIATAHSRVASVASTMVNFGVEFSKDPVSIRGFKVMAWIEADCNLISTFPRVHQCSLRLPFPRFHITPRGCIGFNIQNWYLALATAFPRFHASTSVASGCHFHVSTAPHKVA